ncbi:MAG: hypothetical protein IKU19_09505, partial [Clostridia bacterium]|nr:hypothetical protein [Clostridia bacterium]
MNRDDKDIFSNTDEFPAVHEDEFTRTDEFPAIKGNATNTDTSSEADENDILSAEDDLFINSLFNSKLENVAPAPAPAPA